MDDDLTDWATPRASHIKRRPVEPRARLAARPSINATPQTVGLLCKTGAILETDIDVAVRTFLADPKMGEHAFGRSSYSLNLAAAVRAHGPSRAAMTDATLGARYAPVVIRAAIMLAVPIEPSAAIHAGSTTATAQRSTRLPRASAARKARSRPQRVATPADMSGIISTDGMPAAAPPARNEMISVFGIAIHGMPAPTKPPNQYQGTRSHRL